eukprot:jgi/Psemu1/306944/fgenesh1_kg.290_\
MVGTGLYYYVHVWNGIYATSYFVDFVVRKAKRPVEFLRGKLLVVVSYPFTVPTSYPECTRDSLPEEPWCRTGFWSIRPDPESKCDSIADDASVCTRMQCNIKQSKAKQSNAMQSPAF